MENKKKKILMVAPACLPITGAEAIVNAKLLSALSLDGRFEIDLISKVIRTGPYPNEPNYSQFNINLNKSSQIEVDNKVNLKTVFQHLVCLYTFGVALKGSHWATRALKKAEEWIKKTKYDYILTKNYPSLFVGYYLKKKYGLRWIATWNDPYPSIKYPSPYGKGEDANLNIMENRIMKIMSEYPDIHIFPNERLCNYMSKYLDIHKDKTMIIPHVVLPNQETTTTKFDRLEMVHSGNLGFPRSAKSLLYGLRQFLDKSPGAKIGLTIIGKIDDSDRNLLESLNLKDFVKMVPPVSYIESKKILSKYNLAVIIEADCKEGIFLPTKVADFIEAGLPIFSVSPSIGVLNDLYAENIIPYFAPVSNIDAIAMEIGKIYQNFLQNNIHDNGINHSYLANKISNQYYNI